MFQQYAIKIEREDWEALQVLAKKEATSASQLVRKAIKQLLKQEESAE